MQPLASVACNVNVLLVVAVGVPLRTPVAAFKERPAGSVPLLTVHVYGAAPPLAVTVCE